MAGEAGRSFAIGAGLVVTNTTAELAGVGVEFTWHWGKSKVHFRRNNDCVARHMYANCIASLTRENIPLSTVIKFARKTRS